MDRVFPLRMRGLEGCEDVLEIVCEGICFGIISVEGLVVMDERIRCLGVFTYEDVESLPVFGRVGGGGKVIAGFDPLTGFVCFKVITDCALELSVQTEGFRISGALVIVIELSGSGDEGKVLWG